MPSCLNANECNVRKNGKRSSSNPNCAIALSCASYAALRVNAKYAMRSGGTPRLSASSTIRSKVVVFPVPGGPSINRTCLTYLSNAGMILVSQWNDSSLCSRYCHRTIRIHSVCELSPHQLVVVLKMPISRGAIADFVYRRCSFLA